MYITLRVCKHFLNIIKYTVYRSKTVAIETQNITQNIRHDFIVAQVQ